MKKTLLGQTQTLDLTLAAPATPQNSYYAKILLNLASPKFHECRQDNDTSEVVGTGCVN